MSKLANEVYLAHHYFRCTIKFGVHGTLVALSSVLCTLHHWHTDGVSRPKCLLHTTLFTVCTRVYVRMCESCLATTPAANRSFIFILRRTMAKRCREFDVADLEEEPHAKVHGVVLELSPVKSGRKNPDVKYFSGRLSDGKKVATLVSFDPKLHTDMEKSRIERNSIALVDCKICEGKFAPGLEITTGTHTRITTSPKKFTIDEIVEQESAKTVSIDEIPLVTFNQKINVIGKVVTINGRSEVNTAGKTLTKQDLNIIEVLGWFYGEMMLEGYTKELPINFLMSQYVNMHMLSISHYQSLARSMKLLI